MNALRRIKRKFAEAMTTNPHRRRYLIKHSRVSCEIDPKRKAQNVTHFPERSKKLISKRFLQMRMQALLKKTELVYLKNQSYYETMRKIKI